MNKRHSLLLIFLLLFITKINAQFVGYYNMQWKEMLKVFHQYMGVPNKKIITIPTIFYRLWMKKIVNDQKKNNIDGGLKMVEFTKIMTAELFIDKSIIVEKLGVKPDNMEEAIGASVNLCIEVLAGKTQVIGMKGE